MLYLLNYRLSVELGGCYVLLLIGSYWSTDEYFTLLRRTGKTRWLLLIRTWNISIIIIAIGQLCAHLFSITKSRLLGLLLCRKKLINSTFSLSHSLTDNLSLIRNFGRSSKGQIWKWLDQAVNYWKLFVYTSIYQSLTFNIGTSTNFGT